MNKNIFYLLFIGPNDTTKFIILIVTKSNCLGKKKKKILRKVCVKFTDIHVGIKLKNIGITFFFPHSWNANEDL